MSFLWRKKKVPRESPTQEHASQNAQEQPERAVRDESKPKAPKPAMAKPTPVAACPSCGIVLEPPPSRSRKCPECGEKIVIRTDRNANTKLFLTSEAAAEFDAVNAAASARRKALRQVKGLGLTAEDYDAKFAEMADHRGHTPNPSDVFWELAHEQILRLSDPRTHGSELSQVYGAMAWQLCQEGRAHISTQREATKAGLIGKQNSLDAAFGRDEADQWRVIVVANACCDACRTLDDRSYTFTEAIESLLLPPDDCTRNWCNCGWTSHGPSPI